MRIILSRTDSIGDVVLTLPMTGILKGKFPDCTLIFIGKSYTRPVIERCRFVDLFIDWEEIAKSEDGKSSDEMTRASILSGLHADVIIHVFPVREICSAAKKAGIPVRIATSHRTFTWFTCNRLVHYSRKNSNLHEAQLNCKLLQPLGIGQAFKLEEFPSLFGLTNEPGTLVSQPGQLSVMGEKENVEKAKHEGRWEKESGGKEKDVGRWEKEDRVEENGEAIKIFRYVRKDRYNLILHPRSKGSAREWGLENFGKLVELLAPADFNILVTGTHDDGLSMKSFLDTYQKQIQDLTGKLTLDEFVELIAACDGLVAASTGPLHLAAAYGIRAIGLYAPMRPIFPQRWAPLGKKAMTLVLEKKCNDCRKTGDCTCIRSILPEEVVKVLTNDLPRK